MAEKDQTSTFFSKSKLHPLKINMEHNSLEVWKIMSFLNGWFVGSMLIFQGVYTSEVK